MAEHIEATPSRVWLNNTSGTPSADFVAAAEMAQKIGLAVGVAVSMVVLTGTAIRTAVSEMAAMTRRLVSGSS